MKNLSPKASDHGKPESHRATSYLNRKSMAVATEKFAMKQKAFTPLKCQREQATHRLKVDTNVSREEKSEDVELNGQGAIEGENSVFDYLSPITVKEKTKVFNPVLTGTGSIRVSKEVHATALSK